MGRWWCRPSDRKSITQVVHGQVGKKNSCGLLLLAAEHHMVHFCII